MALVVITVVDDEDGEVQVSVVANPGFNPGQPETELSGAQVAALNMLNALNGQVKQDRGLIQLLS